MAGERFAVRNSGVTAVVEGVGDHGCEYMTHGRVAILGRTGRNFAAGMSGGIAYVLDEHQHFKAKCNLEMVDLEKVDEAEDKHALHKMVEAHARHTGSPVAKRLLANWEASLHHFVKVHPREYKRAMAELKKEEAAAKA
jgi:glutamate synthase domain-containing protein 3